MRIVRERAWRSPAKLLGSKKMHAAMLGATRARNIHALIGKKGFEVLNKIKTTRTYSWARPALLFLSLSVFIGFFVFGGLEYVSLESVKRSRHEFLHFAQQHYAAALILSFLVYSLAAALSLPVAGVMTLTCGFIFGRWVATILVVAAAILGAVLVFLFARYVFGDVARRRLGPLGFV